jgi:hypothetical protein
MSDSANEKLSVHPSRASGRTERMLEDFPFMLSEVEAFFGFLSRITS